MEDTLRQLAKDIITPKFAAIKHSCTAALNVLQNEEAMRTTEAWYLRELCLEPLQMALESKSKKLSYYALSGIQHILKDERFHSSLECGEEEHLLPVQILNALHMTPQLPDEVQVDVMKLLLNMTLTTAWCVNAGIVIKVSQLYLLCFNHSPKSKTGRLAAAMFRQNVGEWASCRPSDTAETIRYLLASVGIHLTEKVACDDWGSLREQYAEQELDTGNELIEENGATLLLAKESVTKNAGGNKTGRAEEHDETEEVDGKEDDAGDEVEDGDDMLADFKVTAGPGNVENAMEEVVTLLKYLIERLDKIHSSNQNRQILPLLLEGILAILSKVPSLIRYNATFQDLIWKQLCPVLIALLGIPKVEKGKMEKAGGHQRSQAFDEARGFLTSSGGVGSSAKIIYGIAAELVRLVGSIRSLRPVLEALFHRILLYPPPQQRLEALKVIKEMLNEPERIIDMAVPTDTSGTKADITDMGLIKLILDGIQEGCHCNELSVCFVSVTCVDNLLQSIEALTKGQAICESVADDLLAACAGLERGQAYPSHSSDLPADPKGRQQDSDGGSVNASSGQLPPLTPPGSPRPVVDSDTNSESSMPDVVKRVTRLRLSDVEQDAGTETAQTDCPSAHVTTGQLQARSDSTPEAAGSRETSNVDCGEEPSKKDAVIPQFSPARKAMREESDRIERQNAAEFVCLLRSCAPQLLTLPFVADVDEALQTFASNFCTSVVQQQHQQPAGGADLRSDMSGLVLNGDGVYTASLAALKLSYALSKCGFYTTRQPHLVPQSQVQFVDSVLGSGLLLYLSPTWLSELYQQTLASPVMDVTHLAVADCALLQLLEDMDGMGSLEIGGQLMYKHQCTDDHGHKEETLEMTIKIEAGQMLARCILSACWEAVLDVLCVLLEGRSSCGITFSLGLLLGTEGAREETQRGRDAICLSLSGLQRASRLCCMLGLQSKCSSAFAQLANVSCVREDFRSTSNLSGEIKGSLKAAVLREKARTVRLHAAHVLSMDVLMTTGLEVGSHAADCWRHVFRCCVHISELEHTYFSRGNHESSLPRIVQQERVVDSDPALDADGMIEMEPVVLTGAAVPVAPRINVAELIRQSGIESGWDVSLTGGGILTPQQAARALCGLSQEVDSLFEDAAKKLNLQALLSFLSELGQASRLQLRQLQHRRSDPGDPHLLSQGVRLPTNALHLYRLQQALMLVVHSPRPLVHLVRVWAAASPYLVEATSHRDSSISKMAVTCIHDFIVAVLTGRNELPHFHINEFLCKTFEDMLCLELCDSDVQDQIVCSICELVEACTQQLQSGWRPLFGALRSVRIEYTANEAVNEARQRHVAAVLDVFEVYLNTDNILVFANATVDCILCLLKYVHGSGMFEDVDDDDDGSDSGSDVVTAGANLQNLCVPALGYLSRCCTILASVWKMPACPIFKGAFRIQLGSQVRTVDPTIPHLDLPFLTESFAARSGKPGDNVADSVSLTSVDSGMLDGTFLDPDKEGADREPQWLQADSSPALVELDKGSGVVHVWYLLLDGLATAISSCPKSFQPQTLTTMFQLLRDTALVPGVKFSLYCMNHLLLPMLQSWLRRGSRIHGYWDTGAVNFKQCCGLTADLVVEFIGKFVGEADQVASLELMLKQLFIVLIECVAQPIENLSLLGCSCIRHVMLSAGPLLTESMWSVSARCLAHAVAVTTHNLRLLMALFHPNSDNFYGDIGQVKVATRKDCVAMDNMRLKQLARQVFLLESQVTRMPMLQYDLEDAKSFVFLIYPPEHTNSLNADHVAARVSLRDMVVGLLSNQLLLQTLGTLLLDSTNNCSAESDKPRLPGLMEYMSTRNIMSLLEILESLYTLAISFDVRPGLKFLLQKVAGLEVAANLYRLAGVGMVLYLHTLTHLCTRLHHLDMAQVKKVLEKDLAEEKGWKEREGRNDGMESEGCGGGSQGEDSSCKKAAGDQQDQHVKNDQSSSSLPSTSTTDKSTAPNDSKDSGSPWARRNPFNKSTCQKLASQSSLPGWRRRGLASTAEARDSADVFLPMLRSQCESICRQYVDILAESQTESLVDRMAGRPLFFLLAQPEDINEITRPLLKRKESDADKRGDRKVGGGEKKGVDSSSAAKEGQVTPLSVGTVVATAGPQYQEEEESEGMDHMPHSSPSEKAAADTARRDGEERESDSKRQYSKRQMRADHESKVYSVATDTVIQNLIGQYRRHKQQNAMPSTFIQFVRQHRSQQPKVPRKEPVDESIDKQQQSSIMKDGEARHRSWSEMLVTIFRLFLDLPQSQFLPLLPAVSPSVTQLIANARDPVLRDVLAQWFQRLGIIYDFMPTSVTDEGMNVEPAMNESSGCSNSNRCGS